MRASPHRLGLLLSLVMALVSGPSLAQEDDLIAPLAPTPAKKVKPKKKVKVRREPKIEADSPDLIAPLTPSKTEILVKLSGAIKGARLYIDEREVGTLPGSAQVVTPGEHLVAVKRPGYSDFVRKVTVAAGKQAEVVATLDAVVGFASVSCEVPGAQVYLNGSPVGPAPQPEMLLPPGTHEIAIKKEGYKAEVHQLVVRAGSEHPIVAKLSSEARTSAITAYADRPEKPKLTPDSAEELDGLVEAGPEQPTPLYARWYVWAGAAVVIAAATTAVVASSQPGPDPSLRSLCDSDAFIPERPSYCR
ncbi:MAG: PEGA domain-containing protein [Myxococcales bacterium]|nr:PEGA domain-containing protein [Myxococcales bacterium]